ncbi:MAG: substrate-binding domain-containing protein [Lentisphaeria bacterium]
MDNKFIYNNAYEKLEQDIRRLIYTRKLLPKQKIKSETLLALNYKISRSTVRKALKNIESEGLIRKVRGSGTFVTEEKERSNYRFHVLSTKIKQRQILFLSFSTAFSERTLHLPDTFQPIFNGLSQVFNACRYNLLVAQVTPQWEPPACLLNGDVAGIIFHGNVSDDFWNRYMKHLPCIGLQYFNPNFDCSWVMLDYYNRTYQMASYLYKLGHRKIAFFSYGMEKKSPRATSLKAFDKLDELGLRMEKTWKIIIPKPRINGEFYPEDTLLDFSNDLAKVFKTNNAPTACICLGEHVALEQAFKKIGLEIPRDVSLISTSNVIFQNKGEKPLTYIYSRLEDICIKAAQMIVELLNSTTPIKNITVLVRSKLIIGETTAKPLVK